MVRPRGFAAPRQEISSPISRVGPIQPGQYAVAKRDAPAPRHGRLRGECLLIAAVDQPDRDADSSAAHRAAAEFPATRRLDAHRRARRATDDRNGPVDRSSIAVS